VTRERITERKRSSIEFIETFCRQTRLARHARNETACSDRTLPFRKQPIERRKSIAAIAVGFGPGSYTGVRSCHRSGPRMAIGHRIKVIGISTTYLFGRGSAHEWLASPDTIVLMPNGTNFMSRDMSSDTAGRESIEELGWPPDIHSWDDHPLLWARGEKWFPNANTLPACAPEAILAARRTILSPLREKIGAIYLRPLSFCESSAAPRSDIAYLCDVIFDFARLKPYTRLEGFPEEN